MIRVNLSKTWCDALRSEGSLSVEWLAVLSTPKDRRKLGRTESWAIEAEPAMWDWLVAWCYQRSTVPVGSSRADEQFAALVAKMLEKVESSIGRMAHHPGYQGRAVKAHSAVVLPAFRCKSPRARWWPTPRMAVVNADPDSGPMEVGWLVPRVSQVRGWTITKWSFDEHHPSYYNESIPTQGESM